MDKIVVRSKSDITFIGERCLQNNPGKNIGVLVKPSKRSEIKIWYPIDEIREIILSDMTVITGHKLLEFCTMQKAESAEL